MEDIKKTSKKPSKGRQSVSAEAFGLWNKKKPYVPKNIPKTEDIKAALKERLMNSFMFRALDEKDLEIVLNAMEEKTFSAGDYVIKQGESGDVLFFVFSGILKCSKDFGDGVDKFLLNYEAGMSFGELALLYSTPRAASIQASDNCVLFSLDRECFNHIVKDSAIRRREIYKAFLAKVEILSSLDDYERSKICDCLQPLRCKAGESIITEGETGDKFYFIEEGKAYAMKKNGSGGEDRVYDYSAHDYFGELALIKEVPRQASIIAEVNFKFLTFFRLKLKLFLLIEWPLRDYWDRLKKF